MIKTGGVNVAPLAIEQVLLQHPDTVQAHVVGVPDQSKGEYRPCSGAAESRCCKPPVFLPLAGRRLNLGRVRS
jgi:hypothetical protein